MLSLSETYSLTSFYCPYSTNGTRQGIYDAEECKDAARDLGYAFGGSRSRSGFPKGCYLLVANNRAYFNTHPRGISEINQINQEPSKRICAEKGSREIYLTFSQIWSWYIIHSVSSNLHRTHFLFLFQLYTPLPGISITVLIALSLSPYMILMNVR